MENLNFISYSVFLLLIYLIYKYGNRNSNYFSLRNIKYNKPKFLIGSFSELLMKKLSPCEFYKKLYDEFPNEKISGIYSFREPKFLIRDVKLIQRITVEDFDNFINPGTLITAENDTIIGHALVSLTGKNWRDMKIILSPAFTEPKLNNVYNHILKSCKQMINYMDRNQEQIFEMKNFFSKIISDNIASCAFGIEIDSYKKPNNEFYKIGKSITNFKNPIALLKVLGFKLFPCLMNFFNISLINRGNSKFLKRIVTETIKFRDDNQIKRSDMIQLLMAAKEGNIDNSIPDELDNVIDEKFIWKKDWQENEIVAQCFLFYLTGFDTISNLLSFICYELALQPELQDNLYNEIKNFKNNSSNKTEISYIDLLNLEYLEMIILEGLRKWPTVPIIDRKANRDYFTKVDNKNLIIEMDKIVVIPIYSIHRDSKFYPNPDKYDPERFSKKNRNNINQYAFFPFGNGPRSCIGSKFAILQTKVILYSIFSNYKVITTQKTQIPIKLEKFTTGIYSEKGIWLAFKRR